MSARPANSPPAPRPSHFRSKHLRILEPLALSSRWEVKTGVPATRADCPPPASGPCPYVSCRHHLWLVESRDRAGNPARGAQGDAAFKASTMESCALDVAELGAASYEEIGALLGVDHTRVRQIEEDALEKLAAQGVKLKDLLP